MKQNAINLNWLYHFLHFCIHTIYCVYSLYPGKKIRKLTLVGLMHTNQNNHTSKSFPQMPTDVSCFFFISQDILVKTLRKKTFISVQWDQCQTTWLLMMLAKNVTLQVTRNTYNFHNGVKIFVKAHFIKFNHDWFLWDDIELCLVHVIRPSNIFQNWCWVWNICYCYLFQLWPSFTIWGTCKVL